MHTLAPNETQAWILLDAVDAPLEHCSYRYAETGDTFLPDIGMGSF